MYVLKMHVNDPKSIIFKLKKYRILTLKKLKAELLKIIFLYLVHYHVPLSLG
jgi:hypothetical protein